jgi:hypothetical protein
MGKAHSSEPRELIKVILWGLACIALVFPAWYLTLPYLFRDDLDRLALIQRAQTAPGYIVEACECELRDEGV